MDNYFHYNGTSNLVVAVTMKSSVVNNNLRFAADTQADNNFIYSLANSATFGAIPLQGPPKIH